MGISTPIHQNPQIHAQVSAEIAARNLKAIPEIPEEMIIAGDPYRIFSVNRKPIQRQHWTGNRLIPAYDPENPFRCKDGSVRECGQPLEIDFIVKEPIPVEMDQMEYRNWSGRKVALDILGIGSFKSQSDDLTSHGVFLAAGLEPTAQEIKAVQAALRKRHMDMIQEARDAFAQGPNERKNITAEHREIALMYNLDEPWNELIQEMINCPGCGARVNAAAAVHAQPTGCGAVLNEKKLRELRLPGYEHIWKQSK